ncbi:hypothetical protein Aperf_G00000080701 [Anoplocephala perfoliata]
MISTENQDNISSLSSQLKRDGNNDEAEEPPRKKMFLSEAEEVAKTTSENEPESLNVISSQQLPESIQKSPLESDFKDPVLLERLKGTIRLRLQSSISQALKGLLNTMCTSMEEVNRLKKVNSDLLRRIKRLEKTTQSVEEAVAERFPPVPTNSYDRSSDINAAVQLVDCSSNGFILNTASGVPCAFAISSAPPVETPMDPNSEIAPLPDIDHQDYPNLPIPPVQPPLNIMVDESSEQGVKLKFDHERTNYPCEPAVSYELFSYASSDVDPRFGPTSSVWQRVGAVGALPLPMSCSLGYLQPGNIYYFAVYSVDRYQRASEWSNVASVPVLGGGLAANTVPSVPSL